MLDNGLETPVLTVSFCRTDLAVKFLEFDPNHFSLSLASGFGSTVSRWRSPKICGGRRPSKSWIPEVRHLAVHYFLWYRCWGQLQKLVDKPFPIIQWTPSCIRGFVSSTAHQICDAPKLFLPFTNVVHPPYVACKIALPSSKGWLVDHPPQ